jgi:hypothetical protein
MRRRLSIVFVCLLLPVAAHAAWDYFESRRLFAAVDELRQRGEPVSRNALGRWQRPTDPEEIKASRYYSAAGELAYRDWTIANRALGGVKQLPLSRIDEVIREVAEKRMLEAGAADVCRTLVDEHADALDLMDTAASLRFSRFTPHEFEDYPRTYSLENLAEAGEARTVLLASVRQGDAAARSLWSTLKLRRAHVRTVPWLTEHVIDLQFLLEHSRPSTQLLEQVQRAFAERERPNVTVEELRETRAIGIESLYSEWYGRRTDPLTPAAHARWVWQPLVPLRPWIARQTTSVLKASEEAVAAAEQPWPENIAALRAVANKQPEPKTGRGRLSIVDYGRYIIRGHADEGIVRDATRLVHVRSAIAVLAIEQFRRARGAPPQTLQQLVPGYMAQVPQDPFTGAPLRFSADANRYVVYSPGHDGKDDGGAVGPLPTHVWKITTADIGLEIRRQD